MTFRMKDLTYEARDHVIVSIMKIIEEKMSELKIDINEDEVWTDDVMDRIEVVFEPYTTGTYESYN